MADRRIAEIKDAIEAQFLEAVLTDRGIPFRIESCADNYWGIYFGNSLVNGWYDNLQSVQPYGYVWGYEDDAEQILQALAEIRASQPEAMGPAKPSMYRIKRP